VSDPNDEPVVLYLAALEARRDSPADFPQPDWLAENLASAPMMQPAEDPEGLREELGANTPGSEANVQRLEAGFVAAAAAYGRRHGMGYRAWIQAGVDPDVLRRAGIEPDHG
jgi:hypothetical protein